MENSTSLPSYINQLYEPYLNEVQKCFLNAYFHWTNEKDANWKYISDLLLNFSNIIVGVEKNEFIQRLYSEYWADEKEDIEKFYHLIETYTESIRNGVPLDIYLNQLNPSIFIPNKVPEYLYFTIHQKIQNINVITRNDITYLIVFSHQKDKNFIIQLDSKSVQQLCSQISQLT